MPFFRYIKTLIHTL